MDEKNTKKPLLKQLRSLVSQYLDNNVTKPSFETIDKDFFAQDHLAGLILLVNNTVGMVYKEGLTFDKEYLKTLPKEEIEKRIEVLDRFIADHSHIDKAEEHNEKDTLNYLSEDNSKKYLLPYLTREINWIVISILSASYVSSLVLMRSVFELTVGIATRHMGAMSERIDRIAFLTDFEKKDIKKLWYRLCAWGHPYGKWLKEVCPVYSSQQPFYHAKLCKLCLEELTKIVDLFLVISIFKYELEQSNVQKKINELGIEISAFKLLGARFSA